VFLPWLPYGVINYNRLIAGRRHACGVIAAMESVSHLYRSPHSDSCS